MSLSEELGTLGVPKNTFFEFSFAGRITGANGCPEATKKMGKVWSFTISSVPNSSDVLILVKRRAKDGRFLDKNTSIRRAERRAKLKFL